MLRAEMSIWHKVNVTIIHPTVPGTLSKHSNGGRKEHQPEIRLQALREQAWGFFVLPQGTCISHITESQYVAQTWPLPSFKVSIWLGLQKSSTSSDQFFPFKLWTLWNLVASLPLLLLVEVPEMRGSGQQRHRQQDSPFSDMKFKLSRLLWNENSQA